jgi:hypothetical protein
MRRTMARLTVLNPIRRALVILALLGLVLSPVASLAHGLTHLPRHGGEHKLPGGDKGVCELCVAFAGVGHAAAPSLSLDLPTSAVAGPSFVLPPIRIAASVKAYRQRAPPSASAK